ncbi:hypothetical protein [Denitromonas halophila]|uniref:Uncharacterized protein n=1 Tax=Denitromonas halophila TaxID=1629404 RepID=A0A557R161_9RHOO|nr:hypothetical protein [Denitromonas halophila]TVO58898.1 hypothetical protein FHP91_04355 [Denitromonas halophila]
MIMATMTLAGVRMKKNSRIRQASGKPDKSWDSFFQSFIYDRIGPPLQNALNLTALFVFLYGIQKLELPHLTFLMEFARLIIAHP